MSLITEAHFHEPGRRYWQPYSAGDDFYELLIHAHRDLSEEQSTQLNARLILLLANHIGDIAVLRQALQHARENL